MPGFFSLIKKKKEKTFLVLDIGTEAVKAALFEEKAGKTFLVGYSLAYFDKYGVFDSRDFEKDILERAMAKVLYDSLANKRFIGRTFIGLPPSILKARILASFLKREKPRQPITAKEEKSISQKIIAEASKNLSQLYSRETGILAKDIRFLKLNVLEIKIDGYRVPSLKGYEGEVLEFKISAIFAPGHYLKEIESILGHLSIKNIEIVHIFEGLSLFSDEIIDGFFLDVGGEITQIFLIKEGQIEKISDFSAGGKIFSRAFSEKMGLTEAEARSFKERYSSRELSQESLVRVKEILQASSQIWSQKLSEGLKKIKNNDFLPHNIYLLGGSALLPEISEILKGKNLDRTSFGGQAELKIIFPTDLAFMKPLGGLPPIEIGDKIKEKINQPQFTPSFLICYRHHVYTQKIN